MAIGIKHGLLDDAMCEDYLTSIGPEILNKCAGFIERERTHRGERRIFKEFENTVNRSQTE